MKRIRHSITTKEYNQLMTYARSDPTLKEHKRLKLLRIFTLMYYTGIRINEISLLTIGKLHELIEELSGVIDTPKKEKERMLHLSEDAAKRLKQLIKDEDPHTLFVHTWNRSTTAMHKISLISMVNGYLQQVLGAGFTSHSFRQGIITDMLAANINTKIVQEFIGHADAKTTLGYGKPTKAQVRRALIR